TPMAMGSPTWRTLSTASTGCTDDSNPEARYRPDGTPAFETVRDEDAAATCPCRHSACSFSRASFDCLESPTGGVAGLVPATRNRKAQSDDNRGGRDKPGHDLRERPAASGRPQSALDYR